MRGECVELSGALATGMRWELGVLAIASTAANGVMGSVDSPQWLIIIMAAVAGTITGAAAAVFMFDNIDNKERRRRGLASVCGGLIIAPFAVEFVLPHPKMIPYEMFWYVTSAISAWGAWTVLRELQRRLRQLVGAKVDSIVGKKDE